MVSAHPRNGQKRIAMTGYPIQNARYVIFLITGKNKADVVEEICHSGDTGPAAYVAHHAQNVELFMDKGAAACIEDPNKHNYFIDETNRKKEEYESLSTFIWW